LLDVTNFSRQRVFEKLPGSFRQTPGKLISAVNRGIISDEWVAPSSTGRVIRRITWTDPDSGQSWQYLTNEMKLSPCLIVLLYRRRWDLEKVYDQFKNKFHEPERSGDRQPR